MPISLLFKRTVFRTLSNALVTLTGHGYDRARAINDLHHKLSYRLFKLAPTLGIAGNERIDLDKPVRSSFYYNARDGGVGHKFLVYQEYEPETTKVVVSTLRPGMHVWNIGANLGYYTVLASKLVGAHGKVTAFEPHPLNLALLRKNITLNNASNVTVVDAAMSESSGEITFYQSGSNTGDHRISNEAGRTALTVRSISGYEAAAQYGPPDAIIMDVQGAEGLILRSLRGMLASHRPILIMEFWPDGLSLSGSSAQEVESMLKDLYQVWRVDEYRTSLLQVNPGEIARTMQPGEETNLLCIPER